MSRIVVLEIDRTGQSPENKRVDEEHHPLPGAKRLVIPHFGAFFQSSLVVKDAVSGQVVPEDQYEMGDLWQPSTQVAGDAVYTCFLLKPEAPAAIKIDYQAFGGAGSRNATEIVNWLHERMNQAAGSKDWHDLKDIPDAFEPEHHKHLLDHVYGMEYVVDQIDRAGTLMGVDRYANINVDYESSKERLKRLQISANTMVSFLVEQAWQEWKKEVTLYTLGVDLLNNYPALADGGTMAGEPDFILYYEEDNRYVDLYGLGLFSKAFVEKVVSKETGLGLTEAMQKHAMRGSMIGAEVGEVFVLPTPKEATKYRYTDLSIYPKGWDANTPMVVVKEMTHRANHGGVFSAFNPNTAEHYLGILTNDTWKDQIVWYQSHMEDDTTTLEQMIDEHIARRGNVHEEDKDQIGLGKLENLPVVPEDHILTREPIRNLVTMDTFMAFLRAHMENITLERKANGKVDFGDTMEKVRVIINGGDCSAILGPKKPKDQFIESFCDGTDKWVRLTDGTGHYYDKRVAENSPDCGAGKVAKFGEKLFERCNGTDLIGVFSDGTQGGTFTEIIAKNSEACGYQKVPTEGTILATYCSDVNQIVRYADGLGGSYDMPKMIDTYICGGKIYPAKDGPNINIGGGFGPGGPGGPGGGDGGGSGEKKIELVTSHSSLKAGDTETWTITFTGFVPDTEYTFQIWGQSQALFNGEERIHHEDTIFTDENGGAVWTDTRHDDGVTVPRGRYRSWVTIESEGVKSNEVTRDFVGADGNTTPNDLKPNEDPNILNVDGTQWNPPGGPQPPRPKYEPKIQSGSDKTEIVTGDTETITTQMRQFFANRQYTIQFMGQHPQHNNGVPSVMMSVPVTTDQDGNYTHIHSGQDTGVVHRGAWKHWVVVQTEDKRVESSPVVRNFIGRNSGGSGGVEFVVNTSTVEVRRGQEYHIELLVNGLRPTEKITLEFYRTNQVTGEDVKLNSTTLSANPSGHVRWDFRGQYAGVYPEAGAYAFYGLIVGRNQYSNRAVINFIDMGAPKPDNALLVFSTNAPNNVIKKGVVETQTVRLTGAPSREDVEILWWIKGAALNSGNEIVSKISSGRTNDNGEYRDEVTIEYDGKSVPAGVYECWASISKWSLRSETVNRTFINEDASTTPSQDIPDGATINYTVVNLDEDGSNITKIGHRERHTITINGLRPHQKLIANIMIKSTALPNGGVDFLAGEDIPVLSNELGVYSYEKIVTHDGTAAGGVYDSYVRVGNKQSNYVTRVLGSRYNPKLIFKINQADRPVELIPGSVAKYELFLEDAQPNKTYQAAIMAEGYAGNTWIAGTPTFMENWTLQTNQEGRAYSFKDIQDTLNSQGQVIVPRGSYHNWAVIESIRVASNRVTTIFKVGGSPTTPIDNPVVRFSSSHQTVEGRRNPIKPGIEETQEVQATGLQPNEIYDIEFWIEDTDKEAPVYNQGQPGVTPKNGIQSDNNGSIFYSLKAIDNGIVPRNTTRGWTTYRSWVVIKKSGLSVVTSNSIERTFEPATQSVPYNPKIIFSTTPDTVDFGVRETQVFEVSGMIPNKDYHVEYWVQSPSFNNNVPIATLTKYIRTHNNGTYRHEMILDPYTGIPLEGPYLSWVRIRETDTLSNKKTRILRGKPRKQDYNSPRVEYKILDANTLAPKTQTRQGETELHEIHLSNAAPFNTYRARIWIQSTALNNNIAIEGDKLIDIQTDAFGNGKWSERITDRGVVPGGFYRSWVLIDGNTNIRSNEANRTFIRYNVQVALRSSRMGHPFNAKMWPGQTETYGIHVSQAEPRKEYRFEVWIKHRDFNGGQWAKAEERSVTVDQAGNGVVHWNATDHGTLARGMWSMYVKLVGSDISTINTPLIREFLSRDPSQAPTLRINSNIMTGSHAGLLWPGRREEFTITVEGQSNTTYKVQLLTRHATGSPLHNSGREALSATHTIQTDSRGVGTRGWSTTDPGSGIVPRGQWETYVRLEDNHSVRSQKLVRTFLDYAPNSDPVLRLMVFSPPNRSDNRFWPGKQAQHLIEVEGPPGSYTLELVAGHHSAPPGVNRFNNGVDKVMRSNIYVHIPQGQSRATTTWTDHLTNVDVLLGHWTSYIRLQNKHAVNTARNRVSSHYYARDPDAVFNPSITYHTNTSVLQPGTTESQSVRIRGARPNTRYHIVLYTNVPGRGWGRDDAARYVTTNQNGDGNLDWTIPYHGGLPEGLYTSYAEFTAEGRSFRSNELRRTVRNGTPTPPPPPPRPSPPPPPTTYRATVHFWTSKMWNPDRVPIHLHGQHDIQRRINRGDTETFYIRIENARPNSVYKVHTYLKGPTQGSFGYSEEYSIWINANGVGTSQKNLHWPAGHTAPSGLYENYAIIVDGPDSRNTRTTYTFHRYVNP